ncbi:carboxylesterase family protein [Tricharina praecox]|uniref:carboxylesterase family protein n=1 Tax=Tricharina praecox TaxID=43433 RepID=UPI00221F5F04|nr:carboxylesterase family protein [Tricharina praecox]KAI5847996.1 carboxylesterase family protein [Tricharina praecox]
MHFTDLLFVLLLALFQFTEARPGYTTSPPPAVNTTSGVVSGFEPVSGVHAYLGIPYAVPPLGLQFMLPKPAPYSEEPIRATAFGPSCIQFAYKTVFYEIAEPAEPQSEDCLSVNIWVPAGHDRVHGKGKNGNENGKGGLPAMVWIVGGGFGEGATSWEGMFAVRHCFRMAHPDVIIAYYRLNTFGFPNSPALPERNIGFLDARLAIEWLHANHASFGGDPSKITLFGESAGAAIIGSYAYAYTDKPLVRALIMQSGTGDIIGNSDDSEFKRVSDAVGCGGGGTIRCLQAVDAGGIRQAISNLTLNYFASPNGGAPGVDNRTLKFSLQPTLIGVNDKQGDNTVPFHKDRGINYTVSDICTKTMFTCPSAGHSLIRANNSVPTYHYRYMARLPSVTPYSWIRGAFHGAEVGTVFGFLDAGIETPQSWEREISKYMMDAWVTFVKDPKDGLRERRWWPQYNPAGTYRHSVR